MDFILNSKMAPTRKVKVVVVTAPVLLFNPCGALKLTKAGGKFKPTDLEGASTVASGPTVASEQAGSEPEYS